jgi:hypothetical protein
MILRRLLQLSAATLIALGGLLWLVQTPGGFQHVIIPGLAIIDLGTLSAEHGELDLRGRLNLTNARYEDAEAGIEISLKSGSLSLDVGSLFGSDPIAIRHIAVEDATLTLRDSVDTTTDIKEDTNGAPPVASSQQTVVNETSLRIPISLQNGSLKNFTFRRIQEEGESVIETKSLLLRELGPDQTASLEGDLRWKTPASADDTTAVQAAIEGELALNRQSVPREWKFRIHADQTTGEPANSQTTGTLSIAIDGDHANQDQLEAHLNLEGQKAGKTFGQLNANISLSGLRGPSLLESLGVEIDTKVQKLSLEGLLSFLPPDPSRMAVLGELHGNLGARGKLAGPLTISTDLVILGLRVEGSPVPTRELRIGLQTTSNLEESGDFLEIADLKIALGEGHLRAHGEATPSKASFVVHVEASDFPVASVLALGGLDTASGFGALPLNGKLDIERDEKGATTLNNDSRLGVRLPGTKTLEVFRLQGTVSSSAQGPIAAEINASQPKKKGKISIQAKIDKTTDVSAQVVDMNLTALVQPFLDAKPVNAPPPAPAENIPLPESAAEADPNDQSAPAMPLKFQLQVDRSQYRDVGIGSLALKADITEAETHLQVDATEFSKGQLSFKIDLTKDGPTRIQWEGEGQGIRLQPLMDAFAGNTSVGGRLKFNTQGRSDEPAPSPAVNGLAGAVQIHLRDGKLEGFQALDMLAQATGVNVLGAFAFSKLDGDIRIEGGNATVKELQAGGAVGNIQVKGTIDFKDAGAVDLSINPRVGPSIAGLVKGFKPLTSVLNTAEGLLSLPINIVITGPLATPKYAVQSQTATEAVSSRGGKLIGGLLDGVTFGGSSKLLGALMPSASQKDTEEAPNTDKP